MARLPRLSLPGTTHYLQQRGHNGGAIVLDTVDVERLLQALRDAALSHGVVLHAYAVSERELRVLATPDSAQGVSRMMQAVGRRYAAQFNRRHGRSGALWDGRFRSALLEPGAATLVALRAIDGPAGEPPLATGAAAQVSAADEASPLTLTSARHRLGGRRDAALVDPPEYWALGNTPFERENRYRTLLAEGLGSAEAGALQRALKGAWAMGSSQFLAQVSAETARPSSPRPRGRPRRTV